MPFYSIACRGGSICTTYQHCQSLSHYSSFLFTIVKYLIKQRLAKVQNWVMGESE